MRTFKAGAIYFLLVFALGWVSGPIRELWAVPRFGRLTALLFEAVIMLIAMIISARWVMRRFEVHQTLGSTIPMDLLALAILVAAEIAGVLWVRGYPYRNILRASDRSWRHLGGHVPAVCRNAVSRHAINTRPRRSDLLSLPVHAKAHCAASRPWMEIREANRGRTLLQ
jgi:hypothetical protein